MAPVSVEDYHLAISSSATSMSFTDTASALVKQGEFSESAGAPSAACYLLFGWWWRVDGMTEVDTAPRERRLLLLLRDAKTRLGLGMTGWNTMPVGRRDGEGGSRLGMTRTTERLHVSCGRTGRDTGM
jgi:hypothetical protein